MIKTTNLKGHFPIIRDREDILSEINSSQNLLEIYDTWGIEQKQLFLDICSGDRGVKMLYDSFFKEILNPETTPERLDAFLSELLKRKVKIKTVLPNDTVRLSDEMSLVITDIVVELDDSSIANIEVQKIGYAFPGERASCYSADLLLRQYKRVRDERKKSFSYKDIAPVYTIVLMEKSHSVFKSFPDNYIHMINEASDTGIRLNMLQNFIFIPIDIFLEKLHNRGIRSKLDAWLTFLGCDEPEYIIELIEKYPNFKVMYSHLYDMCLNIEGVMHMFSKELQLMDQNTVRYMIDEYQEQVDTLTEENEELTCENEELTNANNDLSNELQDVKDVLKKYREKYGDID